MRKLPEGFEERFKAGLLAGQTVTEAAKAAGISTATAYRWFIDHRAELTPDLLKAAARSLPALRLLGLSFRPLC